MSYAGFDAQYIGHELVMYSRGVCRVCDIIVKHQVLNCNLREDEAESIPKHQLIAELARQLSGMSGVVGKRMAL